jgi:DNA-binding NtrC family response regulator
MPSGPRIVASSLELSDVEPLRDSLARTERQSIVDALRKTGGNKTEAAAVLRVN